MPERETLREALDDIRRKLAAGAYTNEEHVRLSLVARVMQALGWDIWNPGEVNTEFYAVPREDKTKVDMALFTTPQKPGVFIEIKAVSKLMDDLATTEKQVRDYNRNNSAPFCVLTDGRFWRLYYSFTAGDFADKCFRNFDLLKDALDDAELTLDAFLSKGNVLAGSAESDAKAELKLTEKQRIMRGGLPKARVLRDEDPDLTLTHALMSLMKGKGYEISEEEARKCIQDSPQQTTIESPEVVKPGKGWITRHRQTEGLVKKADTPRDYTGMTLTGFRFLGVGYPARHWKELIVSVTDLIRKRHPDNFLQCLTMKGHKRPWFSRNAKELRAPERIGNSDIYIDTWLSANACVRSTLAIMRLFKYSEGDLQIEAKQYRYPEGNK